MSTVQLRTDVCSRLVAHLSVYMYIYTILQALLAQPWSSDLVLAFSLLCWKMLTEHWPSNSLADEQYTSSLFRLSLLNRTMD